MDIKQILLVLLAFVVLGGGWRLVGGALRSAGGRDERRRDHELAAQRQLTEKQRKDGGE
jgi:hypothetical protein